MENLTNSKKKKINVHPDTYALREWLKTVSIGDYSKTIQLIKDECKINDSRIKNFRSGVARIKPLEFEKINAIAGYDILKRFKMPTN